MKQITAEPKYEGWTNRATWCVKLWLDNDYILYQESIRHARQYLNKTIPLDRRLGELAQFLSVWVKGNVANRIKLWDGLREDLDYKENHSVLNTVNWREIAESYLEDHFYNLVGTDVIIRSDNAFNGVVGYVKRIQIDTRPDAPYIFKFIVHAYKADGTKWMIDNIEHELTYNELFLADTVRVSYADRDTVANVMRITK